VAFFPLIPESLADEVTLLEYLCKKFKAKCGGNTDESSATLDVNSLPGDLISLERILNELEEHNYGLVTDKQVITWGITQLGTWKSDSKFCDIAYSKYDYVFKNILRTYPSILGRTITFPCISDHQIYLPFSIITAPIKVNDELWKVDFGKEMMVLVHNLTKTTMMIHPLDLKVIYHADKKLPYFDGNGLAKYETPSYLQYIILGTPNPVTEACPMPQVPGMGYYRWIHMTAYDSNKWLVTNFRKEATTVQYMKGNRISYFELPFGNFILELAKNVFLQPSLVTSIANREWRKIAKRIMFEKDTYENLGTEGMENEILIPEKTTVKNNIPHESDRYYHWLNRMAEDYLGFSFESILIGVFILVILTSGMCVGACNLFQRCRIFRQRKKPEVKKRIPIVKPSAAVLRAVDPFLHREGLSSTSTNKAYK
jgi:hypothetical protein